MRYTLTNSICTLIIVLSILSFVYPYLGLTQGFNHYLLILTFPILTFFFMIESKIKDSKVLLSLMTSEYIQYEDGLEFRIRIKNKQNSTVRIEHVELDVLPNFDKINYPIIPLKLEAYNDVFIFFERVKLSQIPIPKISIKIDTPQKTVYFKNIEFIDGDSQSPNSAV